MLYAPKMTSLEDLEAQVRAAKMAAEKQQSQAMYEVEQDLRECLAALTERGISPTPIMELVWKDRIFRSTRKRVKVPIGAGWFFDLTRFYNERDSGYYHSGVFMRTDGLLFSCDLASSADRVQQIGDYQYKISGTEPVLVSSVSGPLYDSSRKRSMAAFLASEG